MESHRSTTIAKLIDDACHKLEDYAAWPESEISRTDAINTLKLLRKTFKDDSYPGVFVHLAACHIAQNIFHGTANRKVTPRGLREAWLRLGEELIQ